MTYHKMFHNNRISERKGIAKLTGHICFRTMQGSDRLTYIKKEIEGTPLAIVCCELVHHRIICSSQENMFIM